MIIAQGGWGGGGGMGGGGGLFCNPNLFSKLTQTKFALYLSIIVMTLHNAVMISQQLMRFLQPPKKIGQKKVWWVGKIKSSVAHCMLPLVLSVKQNMLWHFVQRAFQKDILCSKSGPILPNIQHTRTYFCKDIHKYVAGGLYAPTPTGPNRVKGYEW